MKIIKKAISENRKKHDGVYYERHHILPKSLFPQWKNEKRNIVLLTAKEHFFCHELLTKIYPSKEMNYALFRLATDGLHNIKSPREFERIKSLVSGKFSSFYGKTHTTEVRDRIRKSKIGEKNPAFGKKWFTDGAHNILAFECPNGFYAGRTVNLSDEQRKRMGSGSIKRIGKKVFNNGKIEVRAFECPEGFVHGSLHSPNKGRIFGEEARLKMSKAHKGKKLSDDCKKKISESNKGKKHRPSKYKKTYTMTEEHKKKLSEIRKNKNLHWYTNGNRSIQCSECPDGFWLGRKIKCFGSTNVL